MRQSDPEFLLELLDGSPGIVFVIDAGLTITWANRATSRLLGYEIDEVLGRSVLDFLDADWNPRAFESIATALASSGLRPPMLFRVLSKDGSRPIIEAQANVLLHDPTVRGIVTHARRWTAQWLLDRTLDSVAAGEPISDTLGLMVQVVGAEPMDAPASFLFDPVGDRVAGTVASPALPLALRGPVLGVTDEIAAAWADVLQHPNGRVLHLDQLAPALRTEATAAGFRSLWVWPNELDEHDVPQVWAIAWRDEPRLDDDQTRTDLMARLSTVAALALARWRTDIANAYAASHDTMTGLWNRASVIEHLREALDPDRGSGGDRVGVAFFDLDGFKPINDRYGHAAGDRVLVEVARRLSAGAPAGGRMGRFGGDEFVYAGPVSSDEQLHELGERLSRSITEPIELRTGEVVQVGVSVGTSHAGRGEVTVDELLDRADRALYRRKRRH